MRNSTLNSAPDELLLNCEVLYGHVRRPLGDMPEKVTVEECKLCKCSSTYRSIIYFGCSITSHPTTPGVPLMSSSSMFIVMLKGE